MKTKYLSILGVLCGLAVSAVKGSDQSAAFTEAPTFWGAYTNSIGTGLRVESGYTTEFSRTWGRFWLDGSEYYAQSPDQNSVASLNDAPGSNLIMLSGSYDGDWKTYVGLLLQAEYLSPWGGLTGVGQPPA